MWDGKIAIFILPRVAVEVIQIMNHAAVRCGSRSPYRFYTRQDYWHQGVETLINITTCRNDMAIENAMYCDVIYDVNDFDVNEHVFLPTPPKSITRSPLIISKQLRHSHLMFFNSRQSIRNTSHSCHCLQSKITNIRFSNWNKST